MPHAAFRASHADSASRKGDSPGVMSQLNGVLAAAGFNVSQLHLETNAGIGVAVIDLSKLLDRNTLDAVTRVDGTVRAFAALAAGD